MYNSYQEHTQSIIESLLGYAKTRVSSVHSKLVSQFISQYYTNVAFEDLEARSLQNLYGAAISHWNLFYCRRLRESKLRVYNPHQEEHGWHSTHTIIELVCDDQPFLVDSIRMEINRQGLTNHCLINLGGIKVRRNKQHQVTNLYSINTKVHQVSAEAIIYMEIDRQTDPQTLENLRINLLRVLNDVNLAVRDWKPMQLKMQTAIAELKSLPLTELSKLELHETREFLNWLLENFTFLGYREYQAEGKGKSQALSLIPEKNLGVLSNKNVAKPSRFYSELPLDVRKLAISSQHVLIIAKTNTDSTVHRRTRTDYIGIKRFDAAGQVIGERQFIGLFTSDLYDNDPTRIPILRRKVTNLLARAHVSSTGYVAKHLIHILKTLPRDDLIQANENELFDLVMGIMHLQERRRIRLFVRKDVYSRYLSCLVYVPRDRFNTELRMKIQTVLLDEFRGNEATFSPYFSESILARIHYIIRINPKETFAYDIKAIEEKLKMVGRSWQDDLRESLLEHFGEEQGNMLSNKYYNAFPIAYREAFLPCSTVFDIKHIESLTSETDLAMSFYRPLNVLASEISFKLFRIGSIVPLSDVLPILENMGLRVIGEHPYKIRFGKDTAVWINNFSMTYCHGNMGLIEKIRDRFQEAFSQVWYGLVENDSFNRLVLGADLTWRQVTIFRAYAKYLRQVGFTFSQTYIEMVLNDNPAVVKLLMEIFNLRFNPDKKSSRSDTVEEKTKKIKHRFYAALDCVTSLDEDRILRRYLEVIEATVRVNYFQKTTGLVKPYISFKFTPCKIPELPLPLPEYECFVYGTRFEGVHLRNGKVARGGIRWSSRVEDFRTEVLGLVKAQNVKNAVIVPFGAKGGFITKCLPTDCSHEALMQEGIACYQNFIRGLLDVTDNLKDGKIEKPPQVVCYDEDDPYLVVAADKGTATFSDIANRVADEYQYWLRHGFASGGSNGYDHKKMGITARGAWEAVKHHFFDLGRDINKTDFTVIGIGDMAGDVFGNGMLLSQRIKLLAAFNHMHIFLDPNPHPKTSFKERERLFHLPRSTWESYDKTRISQGGGVYSRSLKSITLSPEVQKMLGLKKEKLVPNALIQALLKSKVDLLWNGGIGTYMKASTEAHQDVLDWSNDNVRVNGNAVQARIIVEGGNLGCTQLGRVEYALHGGKLNTDFIDNAGGVDCSDHEVNIKILLNAVLDASDITTKQRNILLASMTDEVAGLVLYNNYRQNVVISLSLRQQKVYCNFYQQYLEKKQGSINLELEFLPDSKVLSDRQTNLGKGLTRPEIAVLLAYSKISLYESILASDLPENVFFTRYLKKAFPKILGERYTKVMASHHLHREIIATQLSNCVVNDMGILFIYQMQGEVGASVADIVKAYVIAREILNMDAMWDSIATLEGSISAVVQLDMFEELIRSVRRGTRWFLRNRRNALNIKTNADAFSPHVKELKKTLKKLISGEEKAAFDKKYKALIKSGVPIPVASEVADIYTVHPALNIIEISFKSQVDLKRVAKVYFALSDALSLDWLRNQVDFYPIDSSWSILARSYFKANLDRHLCKLSTLVLQGNTPTDKAETLYTNWFNEKREAIESWQQVLAELRTYGTIEFTMLSVALLKLYELTLIVV